MDSELDRLRAQIESLCLQVDALSIQRDNDIRWMGEARINMLALIAALEDAREGKKIGPEAIQLLERARRTCKCV
jgi:hypothetical protein